MTIRQTTTFLRLRLTADTSIYTEHSIFSNNLTPEISLLTKQLQMQLDPATVAERLTISAAECSNAAETCDMTPLAALVPSDHLII